MVQATACEMLLPVSNSTLKLVLHDFKECFYSLLSEQKLIDENYLLINPDDVCGTPQGMQKPFQ